MKALGKLLCYIYENGYRVTGGDLFATTGHRKSSCHYIRLAIDLNVFPKEGDFPLSGKDADDAHNFLHDYWDTLGGAERIEDDLNHYSFEHNGRR